MLNSLIEKIVGRRMLWRAGRRVYLHARRDGSGDPKANGEYDLHHAVARHAAASGEELTVIDIGAFTGYWAEHLLTTAGQAGVSSVRLFAFEPSTASRQKLESRLGSSFPRSEVHILPYAVGEESGVAKFDADEAHAGNNRMIRPADLLELTSSAEEVSVITLVQFFSSQEISYADFVKCDVEGFDLSVIRGALPLLRERRIGLFQFEYNQCWIDTRSFLLDVFVLCKDLNYVICKITCDGLECHKEWSAELERFYEANFVLVRDDLVDVFSASSGVFDEFNTFSIVRVPVV